MRDVKQLGRARSRKNIMISSQARFTDPSAPKTNNPGPGHYGTGMVYGNLLKQVGRRPERRIDAHPELGVMQRLRCRSLCFVLSCSLVWNV